VVDFLEKLCAHDRIPVSKGWWY